jgi:putative lipoic acid-binding regulatory protein
MNEPEGQASLIEYPAPFPLKIMGEAGVGLEAVALEIVRRHDASFVAESMTIRASSGGRYISLTCTVTAVSRTMLDALYRELSAHPKIKYVL